MLDEFSSETLKIQNQTRTDTFEQVKCSQLVGHTCLSSVAKFCKWKQRLRRAQHHWNKCRTNAPSIQWTHFQLIDWNNCLWHQTIIFWLCNQSSTYCTRDLIMCKITRQTNTQWLTSLKKKKKTGDYWAHRAIVVYLKSWITPMRSHTPDDKRHAYFRIFDRRTAKRSKMIQTFFGRKMPNNKWLLRRRWHVTRSISFNSLDNVEMEQWNRIEWINVGNGLKSIKTMHNERSKHTNRFTIYYCWFGQSRRNTMNSSALLWCPHSSNDSKNIKTKTKKRTHTHNTTYDV